VGKRFEGYGWHVVHLGEAANDPDALEAGLRAGMAEAERPSVIILRSHIGWPSPKYTDTAHAHGDPLGADEVAAVKDILGLPQEDFYVPDEVVAYYREAGRRGSEQRETWERESAALHEREPGLADEFDACLLGRGLPGWEAKLPSWEAGGDGLATRRASGKVLSAIADVVPGLLAGGADLSGNTGTLLEGVDVINTHQFRGRQLHFGIREHGMGSIMNGMSVSGTLPAGGTFFAFSDYMRPAVRLAALSQYKVAFVWTHDSVGLGEDGPTHQPVEQLMSLRAMPDLPMIRPADANEVAQAWRVHIDGSGPTGIVLGRQTVPVLEGTAARAAEGLPRGAYVLVDEGDRAPDIVLVGTGSEVSVCVEARDALVADGLSVRVVSFPSWELFAEQPQSYRESVLPPGVPKIAVEAGVTLGWERYADDAVGIDRFGSSAPGSTVLDKLGINPDNVVAHARALLRTGDAR
jgi:transketolase